MLLLGGKSEVTSCRWHCTISNRLHLIYTYYCYRLISFFFSQWFVSQCTQFSLVLKFSQIWAVCGNSFKLAPVY